MEAIASSIAPGRLELEGLGGVPFVELLHGER
jgi:hypothetical protein